MNCNYFRSFFLMVMIVGLVFTEMLNGTEKKSQNDNIKTSMVFEEVEVTAKKPSEQPMSTVSLIQLPVLMKVTPKHLGEILNFTSGTYVTDGSKGESSVMIRGISKSRITLMYDGIPIAEPYFNSFDLKSFASSGIEGIKVIKGAGSVLYGPNTLGGVINIVTHRPTRSFLSLSADFSGNDTYLFSGSTGYVTDRFSAFASASWDQSDGFEWKNDGKRELRTASDYVRKNFTGKFYFYPTKESEIMAEVIYYTANYGIPFALDTYKARYWRFKDWNRLQLNLGSIFPILKNGILKTRLYYINHYNVLDAYQNINYDELQWESTYKNHSYGAFILGQLPISKSNELKLSLNLSGFRVRQQGDIGDEWEYYDRNVYSVGIEDHFSLSPEWRIIAGASIDYLEKHSGETKATVNPILGVRFSPKEWLSFHLSTARKSRFPSMRSLYSTNDGNPDLRDEIGQFVELGFSYQRSFLLSGALFYNYFEDMIQTYRGLDGYKIYQNIGRAEILGFELETSKKFGIFNMNLNYTFLDARDKDTDLRLDYTPKSQFNLFLNVGPFHGFSISLWGVAVSNSETKIGKAPPFEFVSIPAYVTIHTRIQKQVTQFLTLYLKGENILDKQYYTEPGYPMKARTISVGFDFRI